MDLALDFGNSNYKLGLFEEGKLRRVYRYPNGEYSRIIKLMDVKADWRVILSSVTGLPKTPLAEIKKQVSFFLDLDHKTPLPVVNAYQTPGSLGNDRLALAVGGATLYEGQNVMIVDTGTCITYDFVSKEGVYRGGGISPGLRVRARALNEYTQNLPRVEMKEKVELVGSSTNDSILSGILNGAVSEVDGMIERYTEHFDKCTVVLTGGDMEYFVNNLKNRIFAEPNLVLLGLNQILTFNA